MGFAHEVGALVVERRVQEESVVLELEVLVGLADAALAKGQELLAFGESPHGYGPLFESNRHVFQWGGAKGGLRMNPRARIRCNGVSGDRQF